MKRVFSDLWGTNETRAALIVSLALVVSVIIYCFGTSYQMERFEKFGYMYNRITGAAWYYTVDEYYPTNKGR
jgi:hypothetical protein